MRLLDAILDRVREAGAATEAGTIRDGFLSHATEVHALVIGLGAGFVSELLHQPIAAAAVVMVALGLKGADWARRHLSSEVVGEVRQEPWYAVAGVLVGYVVGVAV